MLCGSAFEIIASHAGYRNRGKYCSQSCSAMANNKLAHTSNTEPERRVAELLDMLGVKYIQQYPVPKVARLDFYVPSERLAIQVDGDYWHSRPGVRAKDAAQTTALELMGMRVVRISEHEVSSHRLHQWPGTGHIDKTVLPGRWPKTEKKGSSRGTTVRH